MNLRTVLTNIHRDSRWWRKIMIGGALMMTILGYPFAAGLVVESMDNTRKGYPTPLPPWGDWSSRYLIGIFAWLIDFLFFVLPLLAVGVLFFCVGIGSLVGRAEGVARLIAPVLLGGLGVFLVLMFFSGVSAVGRLIFVEEGGPEHAMSGVSLREALRPAARGAYFRTRLASLPAYIPFLLIAATIVFVAREALSAGLLLIIPLTWLLFCALLYAHLAVGQLYAATDKELEARGLGRLDTHQER